MGKKYIWATSAAVIALMNSAPALADCATTTAGDGTVTLTCDTTITNSSINHNGNNPSTIANYQSITAPLNATINSSATISGWGLIVSTTGQPASATPRPINVVNNGMVSHTVGWDDPSESHGLEISSNSGSIRYSGNGSATTNGTANATGNFVGSTGLIVYASGLGHSVTFGSQAAPITGTFSGEGGMRLVAENSNLDAWFADGTITATRANNGIEALTIQAADSINLTMTGGTVVNGGIGVSLTAGPGHSASSLLTITTNARITNNYSAGAGLTAFSREAGADITLISGASINVANIGVLLLPNTGQSRFTTAAGTSINQTGNTGALRTGLWFNPAGTGSLLADLSGGIAATGTGMLLSPTNGNADITIRAGGSVSGGTAGIQISQGAGGTGTVTIANAGALSAPSAVSAALNGTAFTLTNSGTLSGTVNVAGSSVAGSLFNNSGTWNTNTGASTFAGSLTNSGTINANNGAANILTVNGNLVLTSGSTLRLDVGATQAATDRVIVTGTATLAGSLAAFASGGTFTAGTYTLLTANGGRTGTFSPLTTTPVSSAASLRYDANNVFLDIAAGNPGQTFSFSTRESLVFNAPTVATNRTTVYATQIVGRLLGGTALYDQTFAAAYGSTAVQNGVTAARVAITTAGGPGVIIGDPVRTSSTTTSATVAGTSTYSLAGPGLSTMTSATTFGPATIQTGDLSRCNVSSLPSTTRPTCTAGGTSVTLVDADENFNTITSTVYTVAENRTDTITDTIRETWELNGQVVAVGKVHAEVQSGMLDLSGRLLGRLVQVGPGRAGWADGYHFRVSQSGQREAWGLAGGIALPLGEHITLAGGIGMGWLDIDVPGAREQAEVDLTEGGAALRYDENVSGAGFGASLAVVHGMGKARTQRTIIGQSDAEYDVKVTGAVFEMSYGFDLGGVTVRPMAGLDWVRISSDGFTESDTLGLVVSGQAVERTRASTGLSVAKDLGPVKLAASARYLAILDGGERTLPVAFALAPGTPLTMSGPSEPDTVLLGAQALIDIAPGAQLAVGYDGRFGGGYTSHAGSVGVRISF